MNTLLKSLRTCFVVTACLAAGVFSGRADVLEKWHWRSPLPQGNSIWNTSFLNGKFVAVGDIGTLLTSTDGTNWTRQVVPCSDILKGCAYGNGVYVAVGDMGAVLVSPDGQNWTMQYAGTFFDLNDVAFGNGQFVAVGDGTLILTSADGVIWTQRSSGTLDLEGITHGPLGFVAVGGKPATASNIGKGVVMSSQDGRTWIRRITTDKSSFADVACNGQIYAAVSSVPGSEFDVWHSADLVSWETDRILEGYDLGQIAFGDGKWVVGTGFRRYYYSTGHLHVSTDLKNWSAVATNYAFSGIAFGNGKAVASTQAGTFLVSENGLSWINPWRDPVSNGFSDLRYWNGHFAGLANNQFFISWDGLTWTNVGTIPSGEPSRYARSITYGKGLYVAGGEYRTIWASADGRTWTNTAPELVTETYSLGTLVVYGNGVFLGLSDTDSQIMVSTNGLNWALLEADTNTAALPGYDALEFGNGRFISASMHNVGTSADGTNWVWTAMPQQIITVTAGKGLFLAANYSGIAVSSDGINWDWKPLINLPDIMELGYGGGYFVATTFSGYEERSERIILVSSDGVNWSKRYSGSSRPLNHVAYGNGTFVVSGAAILQSDPFASLELSLKPTPELSVWGPRGKTYRVEYTDGSSLAIPGSWKVLKNIAMDEPPARVTDTNGVGRFYRAVME